MLFFFRVLILLALLEASTQPFKKLGNRIKRFAFYVVLNSSHVVTHIMATGGLHDR